MVGSASLGFSELVAIGACVEYGLRNGKLTAVAGTSNAIPKKFSRGFPKMKEGETNVVTIGQRRAPPSFYQVPPVYQPTPVQQRVAVPPVYQQAPEAPVYQQLRAQAPRQNAQNQNRRQGDRATFNPIPMSYTERYPSLLQKGYMVPRPMGPPPDRLPPWYNPNAHYPFHEGAPGHDLEGCYALKHRVRELIDSKILFFKDMGPNVKNNPLPHHGDHVVNAIEDAFVGVMVEKVDDVKTPLAAFHARLVEAGLINVSHEDCEEYATYSRGCQVVQHNIQDFMNKGVLHISNVTKNEDVLAIEPCFNLPKPYEIPYYSSGVFPTNSHQSPVEICMPTPFPYESTKVVPWKYEITTVDKIVEGSKDVEVIKVVNEDVTNIAGMSRMTHSGQIYTPELSVNPQGPTKESTVTAPIKEPEVVQSEDVVEFLKLIKRSDYKVVDQLHQTPSKISILSLLLNTQAHREALLKVLAQAHVAQSITVDQFDGVVANMTTCNTLSFSREELPEDGQNHNRALHISVKCKYDALARVLVDTGSSLNVMPKRTLTKLSYQGPAMKPSTLIVKAFDYSRRTVIEEVELPILIGPHGQSPPLYIRNEVCGGKSVDHHFLRGGLCGQSPFILQHHVGKACSSFASLKNAKSSIEGGNPEGWGQLIDVREKHDRFGLGYMPSAAKGARVPAKDNT
ncbi:uncharacterized protein LOC127081679 [Lathyrus oleraceus]|uniref:uncharacterized protein LOC127081679 n=1 Tax=Pisum sativum TaxID=3888 RepID=UPI0021CFBA42|nr:uncharacterized protein LOC127081679 [Pisum sativum]